MKNITVCVDEEAHRLVRIRAAELDTSVSALVRNYLRVLAEDQSQEPMTMEQACEREFERRRQLMGEVIEDIRATRSGFRAADNLIREELYDRARVRAEVMGTAAGKRKVQAAAGANVATGSGSGYGPHRPSDTVISPTEGRARRLERPIQHSCQRPVARALSLDPTGRDGD